MSRRHVGQVQRNAATDPTLRSSNTWRDVRVGEHVSNSVVCLYGVDSFTDRTTGRLWIRQAELFSLSAVQSHSLLMTIFVRAAWEI